MHLKIQMKFYLKIFFVDSKLHFIFLCYIGIGQYYIYQSFTINEGEYSDFDLVHFSSQ